MIQYLYKSLMLILCALNINPGTKCSINSRTHFGQPLPIIFRNGQLLEPTDNNGYVQLDHGETLTLSCEGTGRIDHPNAKPEVSMSTASITCEGGDTFGNDEWLNGPSRFFLFRCPYPPDYSSRRTSRTCYRNNPVYEVGYSVHGNFYPLYESCFDESILNAIYSKYTQKPYNALYQTRVERPFFIADDVYGYVPVNTLFSPRGQKAAVSSLVGPIAENYFTSTQLLSRGHLAAKTDFVFAFGERATFHYVNCAPQWTGFNGGNWNTLEVDLRDHIHAAGYNTIIYTGTYGVSQLFNDLKERVDIYLYKDKNNNPVIPVPLYFYKVVYEPSSQCGIAYVGINNPYITSSEARNLFFCQDVCKYNSSFSWLTWHPDNAEEGYTFCCTIPDFTATITHLPRFDVKCLLI